MKRLIKLALFVGVIVLVGKVVSAKKAEWQGLSESEAREKVRSRIPDRVPEEARDEITDKVVGEMRSRGFVHPDEDGDSPSQPDASPSEEPAQV